MGSREVIEKTNNFVEIMINKKEDISQDKLYSDMVKSMREDLYGKKYNEEFPDELKLIIFK